MFSPKDIVYRESVKDIIQKVKLENKKENIQTQWELCKIRIKEFSIKYAIDKNRKHKSQIIELEKEYKVLAEEDESQASNEVIQRMKIIQHEIDRWYTNKCKGAFIRSREKWLEEGERSSKYFLQLEKRRGERKEIDCVEVNGKLYKDNILEIIRQYYCRLYTAREQVNFTELFQYIEVCPISEGDADSCEGFLTVKECGDALNSMNINKSPGCDGLTVEFYRYFWKEIKDLVVGSLNEGLCKGELSLSQRQAVLTLIHKKGARTSLDNWRPISLLNVDYKIAACALAQRLKGVIGNIVSLDQTGFMKNRSALENIRLVQDVIDFCELECIPGMIAFIDFKQAYDNVDHIFLFQLLERVGFKRVFTSWIETLYKNAYGRILNYGWISDKFGIQKGVRKGCPLSTLLFIIVAEVLALKIKQNKNIRGINIPEHKNQMQGTDIKIVQYADDTVLFVNSAESMRNAMMEIDMFGKFSGIAVNWKKSKGMYLVRRYELNGTNGLILTDQPIKCLGVYVGKNVKEVEAMNWEGKIDRVTRILNVWKMRNLTYYGKVTIIKVLVASQITYMATAVSVPTYVVKKINKLVYTFLWGSRKENVKRNVCINQVSKGGLNMVDLNAKINSLRLSWLCKFLKNEDASWKRLFCYWTMKVGRVPNCLQYNCSKKHMINICKTSKLSSFYFDLFCTWAELRHIALYKVYDIGNEIIWNNSNIVCNDHTLHFKAWERAGISKVHQIVEQGRWKEASNICHEYGLPELLFSFKFALLKKIFPNYWLEKMRNKAHEESHRCKHTQCVLISSGDCIDVSCTKTKKFYLLFLQKKCIEPEVLNYWQQELSLPLDFDWQAVLAFKLQEVKYNKIRQFTFKLLHRFLPSKWNLYKWGILPDTTCELCNVPDTTRHMILECKEVRLFWKIISCMIYHLCGLDIDIDEKILIVGYKIGSSEFYFINLLIIFAEFSIYRSHVKRLKEGGRTCAKALLYGMKSDLKLYLRSHVKLSVNTEKVLDFLQVIDD